MKPRFKDRQMQKFYEAVLKAGADRRPGVRTAYWMETGQRRRGSSDRNAYWLGLDGRPANFPRNTLGYAAWAAGQFARKMTTVETAK
jgi:hypothetical protein